MQHISVICLHTIYANTPTVHPVSQITYSGHEGVMNLECSSQRDDLLPPKRSTAFQSRRKSLKINPDFEWRKSQLFQPSKSLPDFDWTTNPNLDKVVLLSNKLLIRFTTGVTRAHRSLSSLLSKWKKSRAAIFRPPENFPQLFA